MIRTITFLLVLMGMISCDSNRVFEVNNELDGQIWLSDSVQHFEFSMRDTLLEHNVMCNIRNANSYPFRNIYVMYQLKDSTGGVLSEGLVNRELFDTKTGKPLGSGIGDVQDHSFPLVEKYKFPYSGNYEIQIQQYMRRDTLPDIVAVGTRVERAMVE